MLAHTQIAYSVVDQGHLCPVPMAVQPIHWAHDHALRLYPLPDVVRAAPAAVDGSVAIHTGSSTEGAASRSPAARNETRTAVA